MTDIAGLQEASAAAAVLLLSVAGLHAPKVGAVGAMLVGAMFLVPTVVTFAIGASDASRSITGGLLAAVAAAAFYAGATTRTDARRFEVVFLAFAAGASVIGLYELAAGSAVVDVVVEGLGQVGPFRARSVFTHPLVLSTVAALGSVVGFAQLMGTRSRRRQVIAGLQVAVCLAAAVASFSKSSVLVVGAGLVWLYLPASGHGRLRSKPFAAGLIALSAVVMSLLPTVREGYVDRIENFLRVGQPVREAAWRVAAEQTTAVSAVVGHGPTYVRTEVLAGNYLLPAEFATLDNQYAALIVDYGLLVALGVLGLAAVAAFRARAKHPAWSAVIVSLAAIAFVFEVFGWVELTVLFFYACGTGWSRDNDYLATQPVLPAPPPSLT